MKKILCLIDNLSSGGAQRQLANIAILLKRQGYEIEFVIYHNAVFFKYLLERENIAINCIETPNALQRILKIRRHLQRTDVDAVIAFLETPGFLACISKTRKVKWKLLTSERSAMQSSFRGLRQKIYNWFERRSDLKICNSQNARRMWEKYYPQYAEKMRVIYNPVMISEPVYEKPPRENGKIHIVVPASYQELKNPLRVIEAVRLLSSDVQNKIRIDWYGSAEVTLGNTAIYDEAQRRIGVYQLQDVIELHEDTNQIYSIMQQADVIGLFSTVEGLPNAICEAMVLGKPVIMTRVSDYEVLADGNGILCDPNPESIAEALTELASLKGEQLEYMGQISKEKADRLFSPEEIIKQWIEVIEE